MLAALGGGIELENIRVMQQVTALGPRFRKQG